MLKIMSEFRRELFNYLRHKYGDCYAKTSVFRVIKVINMIWGLFTKNEKE